jgi:2-polyprenyl-6-methoxyphenol hydroxylase-like FAD-dependent oxidoreductase
VSRPLDTPVLIVGAGPVGLSLALGLARRGVRTTLVERKRALSEHSKAPGILPRTLEIFHQWRVADTVLARAVMHRRPTAYDAVSGELLVTLPLDELIADTRFAGLCILEQSRTESILLDAVRQTGLCDVRFGCELEEFHLTGDGVVAGVRGSVGRAAAASITSRYLVGCDGAGSRVRDLLGLDFRGVTYPVDAILADVQFDDGRGDVHSPRLYALGRRAGLLIRLESGAWRIVSIAPDDPPEQDEPEQEAPPALVEQLTTALFGPGPFHTIWSSRFRLHRRIADRFRVGRVLLAGDAAHLNSPAGAQGMNSGIQDAHNLAWKLAAALDGGAEEQLLESYDAERRAVARQVQKFTDRLTRGALAPPLLRNLAQPIGLAALRVGPVRRSMMKRMAMVAWRYTASPLLGSGKGVGRRVPDVELSGPDGIHRLYDIMEGSPLLLCLGRRPPVLPEPLPHGVRTLLVGNGGFADPAGLLARRFGNGTIVVVRPDQFAGWNGRPADGRELLRAALRVLGVSAA